MKKHMFDKSALAIEHTSLTDFDVCEAFFRSGVRRAQAPHIDGWRSAATDASEEGMEAC